MLGVTPLELQQCPFRGSGNRQWCLYRALEKSHLMRTPVVPFGGPGKKPCRCLISLKTCQWCPLGAITPRLCAHSRGALRGPWNQTAPVCALQRCPSGALEQNRALQRTGGALRGPWNSGFDSQSGRVCSGSYPWSLVAFNAVTTYLPSPRGRGSRGGDNCNAIVRSSLSTIIGVFQRWPEHPAPLFWPISTCLWRYTFISY